MSDGCRIPLAQYPGFNRFVLDWLHESANATRFLPRDTSAISARERESAIPRSAALAEALIASNEQWDISVRPDVERWASGEAITLIAGQQVGFAGGPMYTLAKIATLLKMKRELEARGQKATAFFWLATEDHDFEEVATFSVPLPKRQLDLVTLRAPRPTPAPMMVGALEVPASLIRELLALYDMPRPEWLADGITFRDSFAKLVAKVFGNELVLVDALLPELRRAGAPLFAQIREQWDHVETIVGERSRALQAAGYTPQVESRDGAYTLLFRIEPDGTRVALDTPTDLPPEQTSTSAVTRPLLQDFVLQPDVFVGGPAEVAYYAQITGLHELLGITVPRVALRGHALVAPRRVLRALDRYAVDPTQVFANNESLLSAREPEAVAAIESLAAEARRALIASFEAIGEIAQPADHAVARAVTRSTGHIEYHFDKLVHHALRAVVRKDRERFTAVKELVATLYPDRQVQDRVTGWLAYWREYDQYLVDRIIEEIEPDSSSFRIVTL